MKAEPEVDPIALLADLLRDGDQQLVPRAFGRAESAALATLVGSGLIVPTGVIETTICDACDADHLVDVITGGLRGAYGWHCPAAGFVEAEPDAVAALSLSMENVASVTSRTFDTAFGAHRWQSRPLGGGTNTLVLGAWSIGGASTTVALARNLDCTDVARRTAAELRTLAQNDAGLILTVGERPTLDVPRFATVPLSTALFLDGDLRLGVAVDLVKREIAPIATKRLVLHGGRPSVQGKVFAVVDSLFESGRILDEREVNAGVVKRAWHHAYPAEKPPAERTLARHIAAWRARRESLADS